MSIVYVQEDLHEEPSEVKEKTPVHMVTRRGKEA